MRNLLILLLFIYSLPFFGQTLESNFSSIGSYFHNSKEIEKITNGVIGEQSSKSGSSLIPLALNLNTKEKQIDVRNSYLIPLNPNSAKKKNDLDLILGLSIGGKMDNSYTSFFKNKDISGGFKFGSMLAIRLQQSSNVFSSDSDFQELFKHYGNSKKGSKDEKEHKKQLINYVSEKIHNATYWFYLSPNWEGRKFINVDEFNSTEFTKTINTLSKISFGVTTYQNDLPFKLMGFIDLNLSFNQGDNFGSLTEISSSKKFSTTDNNNNVISENKETFTSFYGNYNDNVKSKTFGLETYLVKKDLPLFAINLNPIYEFDNSLYKSTINFNYTIYFLSTSKSVLSPNFGLTFSHQDILKNRDELFENDKSRFSIGLVTKLNIGEWFN